MHIKCLTQWPTASTFSINAPYIIMTQTVRIREREREGEAERQTKWFMVLFIKMVYMMLKGWRKDSKFHFESSLRHLQDIMRDT